MVGAKSLTTSKVPRLVSTTDRRTETRVVLKTRRKDSIRRRTGFAYEDLDISGYLKSSGREYAYEVKDETQYRSGRGGAQLIEGHFKFD